MITGVVLAGGASRRYGRDKALVEVDGETLVARAVAALRAAGCERVVVAGGPDAPRLEAALGPGVELVGDRGHGPLAALGAVAASAGDDDLVVLACDLVGAAPVVARLAALAAGTAAVAVDDAGRVQPLCARWPAAGVVAVATSDNHGGRAMALVDHLDPVLLPASAEELQNRNQPD